MQFQQAGPWHSRSKMHLAATPEPANRRTQEQPLFELSNHSMKTLREKNLERSPRGIFHPRKKEVLIDTSTVTAALFSTLDFQPSGSALFSARLEASQELLIAAFLWDCCGIVQESVQRVGRMLQNFGQVAQRMLHPAVLTSQAIFVQIQNRHLRLLQRLGQEYEYQPATTCEHLLNLQITPRAVAKAVRLNGTSLLKDLNWVETPGYHQAQTAEAFRQILDRLSDSSCRARQQAMYQLPSLAVGKLNFLNWVIL